MVVTADSPGDGSLVDALNGDAPGFTGGARDASVVNIIRALKISAQVTALQRNQYGSIVGVTVSRPMPASLPLSVRPQIHK